MTEYISIQDFANKSGLSRQTVYNRRQYINQYYKDYRQKNKRELEVYHNTYWENNKEEINAKRRKANKS